MKRIILTAPFVFLIVLVYVSTCAAQSVSRGRKPTRNQLAVVESRCSKGNLNQADARMLKIREGIHLGDGYENVLRSYWQHGSRDLTLYAGNPQTWTVLMPHELGARNWVLFIEFVGGKVSALKVRTSDGPPPNGAPADVGS